MTFPLDEPTFAGELHGVRTWRLERDANGDPALAAIGVNAIWPRSSAPLRAECAGRPSIPTHVVPVGSCTCGIYANHPNVFDAYGRAQSCLARPRDGEIAGVIEAWGKVEMHSAGFRAEWARPAILFATRSTMGRTEELADAYGARALLVPSRSALGDELRKLNAISNATVRELLRAERRLLLTPGKGSASSNGLLVSASDLDGEGWTRGPIERFGVPLKIRPRSRAGIAALQAESFNLARRVRLVDEGQRVSVWDERRAIRLGRGHSPDVLAAIRSGSVRQALVVWQWRDPDSRRRTAVQILATPLERIAIRAGRPCRPIDLLPGERLF